MLQAQFFFMFTFQLFLGFPVDELYAEELSKANPYVVAQFIQKEGDYLREITYQDMRFFGKFLGHIAELQQIELLEANIYSLLKKLVPNFSYQEIPLYLFPIEESHGPD